MLTYLDETVLNIKQSEALNADLSQLEHFPLTWRIRVLLWTMIEFRSGSVQLSYPLDKEETIIINGIHHYWTLYRVSKGEVSHRLTITRQQIITWLGKEDGMTDCSMAGDPGFIMGNPNVAGDPEP